MFTWINRVKFLPKETLSFAFAFDRRPSLNLSWKNQERSYFLVNHSTWFFVTDVSIKQFAKNWIQTDCFWVKICNALEGVELVSSSLNSLWDELLPSVQGIEYFYIGLTPGFQLKMATLARQPAKIRSYTNWSTLLDVIIIRKLLWKFYV